MALMVLQYIPDGDDPWGIVGHVLGSLPPGSYLTVSDTVRDIDTGRVTEGTARLNQRMGPTQLTLRTRPDFERFFDGLEMVEPGVVPLPDWHGPGSGYPIPATPGWAASLSDQLAMGGSAGRCHPCADFASASMPAVSAFNCLASIFRAFFISRSIFAPMSDTPTTTRPACPASRCSPSSFRSWRLIPAAA